MPSPFRRLMPLVLPLALAALAPATQAFEGAVDIVAPYVQLPSPTGNATSSTIGSGSAYMLLHNASAAPRRLVRAESPLAKTVELRRPGSGQGKHTGEARMQRVREIVIPAHAELRLRADGPHLVLVGVQTVLSEGDAVPLLLGFDDGSELRLAAPVRSTPTTAATGQTPGGNGQ